MDCDTYYTFKKDIINLLEWKKNHIIKCPNQGYLTFDGVKIERFDMFITLNTGSNYSYNYLWSIVFLKLLK